MATIVSNALKTAAIGGLIGFGVGMVGGMVKKKTDDSSDDNVIEGEAKDAEIESMGHRLHDYGDSRPIVRWMYDLAAMETGDSTDASIPQEAHSRKHNIEVALGQMMDDTPEDRRGALTELVKEIMEFVEAKTKNITFNVQERMM